MAYANFLTADHSIHGELKLGATVSRERTAGVARDHARGGEAGMVARCACSTGCYARRRHLSEQYLASRRIGKPFGEKNGSGRRQPHTRISWPVGCGIAASMPM